MQPSIILALIRIQTQACSQQQGERSGKMLVTIDIGCRIKKHKSCLRIGQRYRKSYHCPMIRIVWAASLESHHISAGAKTTTHNRFALLPHKYLSCFFPNRSCHCCSPAPSGISIFNTIPIIHQRITRVDMIIIAFI